MIEVFYRVSMLSIDLVSGDIGAFVIEMTQISTFFAFIIKYNLDNSISLLLYTDTRQTELPKPDIS